MRTVFRSLVVFFCSVMLLGMGIFASLLISTPQLTSLRQTIPYPTAYMKLYWPKRAGQKKKNPKPVQNIPLSHIPKLFQRTVILAEDASFWIHKGIDWFAVRQSLRKNLSKGKFVRGGSTITQQVARNLYLSRRKSIFRKLQEMWIASRIEAIVSKRRILEIYFNIIEWGPGIFGVKAASQYYFKKLPEQLTLKEIILLTATIPSPLRENPYHKTARFYWRCRLITRRLWKYKVINDSTYQKLVQQFVRR